MLQLTLSGLTRYVLIFAYLTCCQLFAESESEPKYYQAVEIIAVNNTRKMEASNLTYASMPFHPGDQAVFNAKVVPSESSTHAEAPYSYIWYIPGQPAVRTNNASYEWTVPQSSNGESVLYLIVTDANGHVSGAHFNLFVGCFETPVVSITDGVTRPNCPLTLRARIKPYKYAAVRPGDIHHYTWRLERKGQMVQEFLTNTDTLELNLPGEPGPISVSVFAVDEQENQSPEQKLDITVKPW